MNTNQSKKPEVDTVETSTMRVSPSNKTRLKKYGEFGESHNDVLTKVLNKLEKNRAEAPKS